MAIISSLSLSKIVASGTGGAAYHHPALSGSGRFGRCVDLTKAATGVTAPGNLLPGQRNLKIAIADVLRPPLVFQAAGAVVLEDTNSQYTTTGSIDGLEARWLVGDQSVEAAEMTTSNGSIGDSISIARVEFSRLFKLQYPTAEALLRGSMQRALRTAMEKAGLAGTGGWEPGGLINDAEIQLETGALTAAALVDDAQQLVMAGCDAQLVSIIASAENMADLLGAGVNTEGRTTTGALHNIKGFGVRFSPYLAAGESVAGQFDQLNLIYYGSPEVLVDPYTNGAEGATRITVFQACGLTTSHSQAFVRRRVA